VTAARTLLALRPQGEVERSRARAAASGWALVAAPLFAIAPLPATLPPGPFDAMVLTSPQTPRLLAALGGDARALDVYAVGERTAEAARAAGFRVVAAGAGDGTAVVAAAAGAGHRRLLHPGGADRAPITVPAGVELVAVDLYRAVAATALDAETVALLRSGGCFATLLFSQRSAALFVRLGAAAGLARGALRLVALSPNVAAAAGQGWRAIAVAALPTLDAALAAADRLWQREAHG
jgi:uroporphyrinogen-III synthase